MPMSKSSFRQNHHRQKGSSLKCKLSSFFCCSSLIGFHPTPLFFSLHFGICMSACFGGGGGFLEGKVASLLCSFFFRYLHFHWRQSLERVQVELYLNGIAGFGVGWAVVLGVVKTAFAVGFVVMNWNWFFMNLNVIWKRYDCKIINGKN